MKRTIMFRAIIVSCLCVLLANAALAKSKPASELIPVQGRVLEFGDISAGEREHPMPPNTTLENKAGFGEIETQQVGGADSFGRYFTEVGAIRCPKPYALVGMKVRRGSAIDSMQAICVGIGCGAGGCGWMGRPGLGVYAGNRNGGSLTDIMVCTNGYVVAGFRASSDDRNIFLRDIALDCGLLSGRQQNTMLTAYYSVWAPPQEIPMYGRGNFGRTARKLPGPAPREWAHHFDENGRDISAGFANRSGVYLSRCVDNGATAFSVAVGRFGLTQTSAIQAFSMFCGGATPPQNQFGPQQY